MLSLIGFIKTVHNLFFIDSIHAIIDFFNFYAYFMSNCLDIID